MAARIQLRRDTSSNWSTTNPTLNSGELGVETNTSKIKLGDGSTAWNSLDYVVYPLAFSDLLNKPTTIAGYGITDAFDGTFSSLTGKPTTRAGYGITDAMPLNAGLSNLADANVPNPSTGQFLRYNGTNFVNHTLIFSNITSTPTTIAGYGITDAFDGFFGSLSGKPTTISGYGITDAFDGAFTSLTGKPTTIAGYGITDAFDGAFSSLTGTPTTIAGYGITDAFDGAFSSLTGTPNTLSGYGITDAFDGAFSSLSGIPTTLSGYGITDAAPIASPALTGTPTAPTAALGTNTTQLATTAFVTSSVEEAIETNNTVYFQDTAPTFDAFAQIWFDTNAGGLYKSVASSSTVPLDNTMVSSSSSTITIPAPGASDTRLELGTGLPSGTVSFITPIFIESFSSTGVNDPNLGVVTYADNTTATIGSNSATRSTGNALDTKIKSFTFTSAGTTNSGNSYITLTVSAHPVWELQDSDVQAKVDAIIDSAPGALDTLNELAAALGDDANFSTTITNNLALKANLASPAFSGSPTAPTPTTGSNGTAIATTAFVQTAIADKTDLTDFSVTTGSASSSGALSYNNTTGVFSFTPADLSGFLTSFTETDPVVGAINGIVKADGNGNISAAVAGTDYSTFSGAFSALTGKPTTISGYGITDAFDGAFSSLTGTPTTLSGYGITDAAPLVSPALTGTPTAPTATNGTNTTQIATTAYVQGEISSFPGGDSQADFTASGAITQGKAVILSSTAGQVEEVSQAAVAGTHTTAVSSSNSTVYRTQAAPLDYNDQDSVYQQFWYDGSNLVGSVWSTNLGTLTLSAGTGQSLIGGVTPDNYFHIRGTSTGILRAGTNSYVVTNSSGTLSIGSANAVGAYSKIVTTENGDLIALNGSDCYFVTVSGTTISFGSAIAIGLTPTYQAFEWSPTYDKLVAATISSGTITYTTGTVSGSNITWASVSTESSWGSTSTDIAFHVGVERLIGFRRHFIGSSSPTTVKFRSSSFNGSAFAFSSSTETTLLGPSNTNPSAAYYYLSPYIKCSKTDGGFGIFTKYEYNSTDRYLGNLTSGGVFSIEVGGSRVVTREYGTTLSYRPGGENDPAGYLSMGTSSGQTSPSNNSSVHGVFFRTSAVSTKDSYLGIAQSTVSSGSTVTVMLAGAVSDVHSSLTPDTKMYVQNDGTITSTVSTVIAGTAINATSIQIADGRGTFDKAVSFTTLSDKPTTLVGYGITDAISSAGDVDIGSSDFITTGKSYYANMFATTGDLPSATTYHGMFAHVHGTGAGYFAHAGNWVELANKSYVDTEVANIVNSAPATLDTLDELAAALNDDANFATTVTTSLGLKAPLASPALTGTPTAPTAASGTNTTQLATTEFVTAAVAGASGTYTDSSVDTHLNTSTASSGEVLSWNGTDYDWVAQSVNISIDDLSDVDTTTSAPTDGQALVWNNAASEWRPGTVATSGGTSVTVSETAPSSPSIGDLWFDPSVLKTFVYYNDGTANQWVQSNSTSGGSGGGSSVSTSDTAPTSPNDGDLWLDTTNNDLFVYYEDTDSSQWIEILGGGSSGGTSSVTTSDTAPTSPNDGDLWFDTTNSGLFIYYQDTDSSQWIEVVGSSTGGSSTASGTDWKEKTAAYTAVAGEGLIVDTSTAVTVTLPASATLGDEVKIIDGTGNAATNNITVARNGHKINGDASDLTVDVDRAAFGLVYYNTAQGWLLTEK